MESLIKIWSKETVSQKSDNAQLEEDDTDPAKFLFKHSEYHDCYFLVGDPASESLEKIGVVSSHLVAHSPVFRTMLKNEELDKTQINIAGVTPEMFKLMLTYVYGGELPELDLPTAAQLALCADMYLIQPLVDRACKLIVPSCVAEVFPALWIVSYISCPDLEPYVSEIIQEDTKALIDSSEFLDLDPKCLEFITKQEQLAISEHELWKALVEWARNKVEVDPSKPMRKHLEPALQHVRLATFSQEEVIKEVIPTKILTSTEVIELLTAITSNQDWGFPGLCKTNKMRGISAGVSQKRNESTTKSKNNSKDTVLFKTKCIFDHTINKGYGNYTAIEQPDYQTTSNLTLKTIKDIQLNSFTFKTRSFSKQGNQPIYKVSCTITVTKIENGFCKDSRIIQVGGSVVCNESIAFPLKLRNGQPLQLEANSWYNVALEFSAPHPVFLLQYSSTADTYVQRSVVDGSNKVIMTLKYNTPAHVESISLNF